MMDNFNYDSQMFWNYVMKGGAQRANLSFTEKELYLSAYNMPIEVSIGFTQHYGNQSCVRKTVMENSQCIQ